MWCVLTPAQNVLFTYRLLQLFSMWEDLYSRQAQICSGSQLAVNCIYLGLKTLCYQLGPTLNSVELLVQSLEGKRE